MRTINLLFLILILVGVAAHGQSVLSVHQLVAAIKHTETMDSARRTHSIDSIWNSLTAKKQIPFIAGDSVAFLFRGTAKSVQWAGDFNRWGADKNISGLSTRIGNTNIWVWSYSFPANARLDYKIILDGNNWIIDPENSHQQWSGVGGGSINSELRMPEWKDDPIQQVRTDIHHGTIIPDILFKSKALGYQLTYSVYLPADYDKAHKLPVVYVTDGYEYLHPKLGNMATVLDNLIADKRIQPVMCVFVDHREPINRSNNRRMEELAMSAKFLQFFTDELIPEIEASYPAQRDAAHRAILGTSMGGLTSAYFVFSKPGVFSMAGIQSPAFYTRPQIYSLCEKSEGVPVKISMTSGTIYDTSEGGRKMKAILEQNSCKYTYREVNEGHSWGNWRNLIDDILVDFFGQNQ